jgi:hypothetical protein
MKGLLVPGAWSCKPIHADWHWQVVVDGDVNLSALGHAHQRSRILQLVASLAKRVHRQTRAIFALRVPNTFADLESEG